MLMSIELPKEVSIGPDDSAVIVEEENDSSAKVAVSEAQNELVAAAAAADADAEAGADFALKYLIEACIH